MNISVRVLFAAIAGLTAFSARAHDPSEFDSMFAPAPRPAPTTCAELADTQNYWADPEDAMTKDLKSRCDAEQAKAPEELDASKASDAKGKAVSKDDEDTSDREPV